MFYGYWDYRFLSLIFFSSLVDYFVGQAMGKEENQKKRKYLLWLSLFTNLSLLGVFKYYNFFMENFIAMLNSFGLEAHESSLEIILPVGISFYTFQTLSYTIDIYKKQMQPTKDFIQFFAFVSFFPQLVAGPIERASHLLPQFNEGKHFNYDFASSGIRLILWGLFKKVVIADNCALYSDAIFNSYQYDTMDSSKLFLGGVFFAFQIYGDFSGYSDIAIGTGRLFGFDLMANFKQPYFSTNVTEFWRRWHISLSNWFRDYVYIPLGGSKSGIKKTMINLMITFTVSGLWHGANWTFIAWGALNGIYLIIHLFIRDKKQPDRVSLRNIHKIIGTFLLTVLAWVFFRAENISLASDYLYYVFANFEGKKSLITALNYLYWDFGMSMIIMMLLFLGVEWYFRNKEFVLDIKHWHGSIRMLVYLTICVLIVLFGNWNNHEFIYFQF